MLVSDALILSSYAAAPTDAGSLTDFQTRVRELSGVAGLELPFTQNGLTQPIGLRPEEQLSFGSDFVVTALPLQMESMQAEPSFGLASVQEAGRRSAVARFTELLEQVAQLLKMRPDLRLRAIAIPTGPRSTLDNPQSSPVALLKSLETLLELKAKTLPSLPRPVLAIEHCDAASIHGSPCKGFLSLEHEFRLAKQLSLGIIINWGRSAIEGRSEATPRQHLQIVSSVLRGVTFSGVAVSDPLYGDWADTHAPVEASEQQAKGARKSNSILTVEEVGELIRDVRAKKESSRVVRGPEDLGSE